VLGLQIRFDVGQQHADPSHLIGLLPACGERRAASGQVPRRAGIAAARR
jgi:hypothetical protein